MRLRSLESRIVILFLVLILILSVQLIGFTTIRIGIQHKARTSIRTGLPILDLKQRERTTT